MDRMIGGIPNGSVILLTGRPGSGFDIFAQQTLFNSARDGNCKVLYATVDRPPEDIETEMTSRKWDIQSLMADKKWSFLDAYSIRSNERKGVSGKKYLLDSFTGIPSSLQVGTWSAIDTLTYLLESLEYATFMGVLDELIRSAREKGGLHYLLLVQGLQEQKVVTSIAHMADGLINFKLDPEQAEAYGNLRIVKLRMAHHVTRLIPYRITEGGLSIETVTRVT